jgi:threonylcarbamoyladenosine tRNA methylthiotransferase MtaB
VTVVNTCTVTGRSDARCRAALRKARRTSPRGTVVAAGCYAQAQADAVAGLPEVDLVLGNRGKSAVFEHLDEEGRPRARHDGPAPARAPIEAQADAPFVPIRAFAGHTRAFVKIQDGCDARCSYCIVPQARGASRSLPEADALAQVAALAASGYREVVLTGVHLGGWGRDLTPRTTLAALLGRLLATPGLGRLRLSSIEPTEFTPELLGVLAAAPAICRHFHIPLQSGAAPVLRAMRRPYGPEAFAALVRRLVDAMPDAGIGADVIAGFPGEREEDFEATAALVRSLPLGYLHVFPYSPRPGSPAAAMAGQVPPDERERRAAALRELGREKAAAFRDRHVGRAVHALIEVKPGGGETTVHALTGNYLKVVVRAAPADIGTFRNVRILRHEGGTLHGELAD